MVEILAARNSALEKLNMKSVPPAMAAKAPMAAPPASDEALYAAYLATGDVRAFETFVALHRDSVYDFARRCVGDAALAEDIAQEVFLKIFLRTATRTPALPIRAWLLGVTRHVAMNARRADRRREAREDSYSMNIDTQRDATNAAPALTGPELRHALEKLPPDMQLPIALHFLHGLSQPEVATTLGIPAGTVGSRIARGLTTLRTSLAGASGAAFSAVMLEASLRTLPLAQAPASVGAVASLQAAAHAGHAAKAGKTLQAGAKFGAWIPKAVAAAAFVATLAAGAYAFGGGKPSEPARAAVLPAIREIPKGDEKTPPPPESTNSIGVVSYIKVLSDKVPDVSSLDAWKKSYIKDGMSDEEKARTVWKSVWTYQYQDGPPNEFLHNEGLVQDVMKIFNVYGYSFCGVATADTEQLARHVGVKARGWTINRHVVSEMYWDDAWHLMDGSLIVNFPKADGKIASVDEIFAGVADWYGKNPGYKGNEDKLRELEFKGAGFKTGPDVLTRSPSYDDRGWLPAMTHGWYSNMGEYDGSNKMPWEPGYAIGYQVNIQLRKGERLTRNWSNTGLHVNMLEGGGPGCISMTPDKLNRYNIKEGDLTNGRVGNGKLDYAVPLADGSFKAGALSVVNLATSAEDKAGPAVHVQDAAKPGELILRMPCSYIYLSGDLFLKSVIGDGGSIAVAFSDNHGHHWKDVTKITASGEQHIDLKPFAFRRYEYQLKVTLTGKGTGLDALQISHDIQHSQRPLPALGLGDNTISFNAGAQEGTITLEANTDPAQASKQIVYTDYDPAEVNITRPGLMINGAEGSITFPIETPGDMTRLRFGSYYRARDAKAGWDYQVSFDGKSFKTVDRASGPVTNDCKFTISTDVPAGTRKAWVRYAGTTNNNATMINAFRIDADYKEPHGGFAPVKITYNWEEAGVAKQDIHIAKSPDDKYTIKCATKPTMKSIVLELE